MLELMVEVALAEKQRFPGRFSYPTERAGMLLFWDQLYVLLLSFTLPKAGKTWLATLRKAKCIFTHASDKIWAKLRAEFYKALSASTQLGSQENLMLPSRHAAIAEAVQLKS